jgi:hypothetical protein
MRSIYWAVRFMSMNRWWRQLLLLWVLVLISKLSLGAGKVTRMVKPKHLWPDLIEKATHSLYHMRLEHIKKFLSVIQSSIWGSCNGYPPVISIISLYLWYQVEFVIIIVGFGATFISITHLNHIIRGWTIPVKNIFIFLYCKLIDKLSLRNNQ